MPPMSSKFIVVAAASLVAAASPALARQDDPAMPAGAPAASEGALYCLRVEPITGSRIETIRCETRQEWILLGVDLDRDWAK